MARKRVDTSKIEGLIASTKGQEIQKGTPRTWDPAFPLFATPVNTDILVYIPRTNVHQTENGETMEVLESLVHEGKAGNSYVSLRCIHGLQGNPLFDELGYDGSCPACEATQEAWELYRHKLNTEAARIGIDPQNDPNDTLKSTRERILSEMDMKGAEEYVTFPVVVIPMAGKMTPAPDALETMQVQFVHWRKKRYNDTLMAALDALMVNPGHPAGLFWYWKFSYDTKGKQANARDSAKSAKYNIIQDVNIAQTWKALIDKAEEKAKEFTITKAVEVVVAVNYLYKEDMLAEVNKCMVKTRQVLELAKTQAPGAVQGAALQSPAGGNALLNFGTTAAPANLGGEAAAPAQAPAPVAPAPVAPAVAPAQAPEQAAGGVAFGVPSN